MNTVARVTGADHVLRHWRRWLALAGAILVAGGACAAVLRWGGAIEVAEETAFFLDPGLTPWLLPMAKVAMQMAAAVTVGCLLAVVFLVPGETRVVGGTPRLMVAEEAWPWLRGACWAAAVWVAVTVMAVFLTWANLLGVPVSTLDVDDAFVVAYSTDGGRALLVVLALAAVVMSGSRGVQTVNGSAVLLALAVAAVLPPAFTGHAASSTNHQLAISLMVLHSLGAVLWTGGLVALLVGHRRTPPELAASVRRYSRLAACCLAVVGATGLVSAVLRLASWDDLTSGLSVILGVKLGALIVLTGLGGWHRRASIPALAAGRPRTFTRIAWVEVLVMAATLGVAGGLARTPPPAKYGIADLIQLPIRRTLEWTPDPVFLTLAVAAVTCYLIGVRRLHRAGRPWPGIRTAAWLTGWLVVLAAASPKLTTDGPWTFGTNDRAQYWAIAILAPALMVLAKPVLLGEQTWRPPTEPGLRGPREWLDALRNARLSRWAARPPVALGLYAAMLYGVYASIVNALSITSFAAHMGILAGALGLGYAVTSALTKGPGVWRSRARVVPLAALLVLDTAFIATLIVSPPLLVLGLVWCAGSAAGVAAVWIGLRTAPMSLRGRTDDEERAASGSAAAPPERVGI